MCGRYTLHLSPTLLAEELGLIIPDEYSPDYNITPGSEILCRTATSLNHMHWGVRTPQNFHVNARLETADTTPRFRDAWLEHRCIVPANGFYEWLNDGVRKQPYYLYQQNKQLLYFAGLWFPGSGDSPLPQCVLLTTAASPSVKEIHSRMPVALPQAQTADWLHLKLSKMEALECAQAVDYEKYTVSSRVNNAQHKDSTLVTPTSPALDDQMQLF
ncbi:MAG: SOS response-associated peptidase [Coraliomargaritaceae bacterium]